MVAVNRTLILSLSTTVCYSLDCKAVQYLCKYTTSLCFVTPDIALQLSVISRVLAYLAHAKSFHRFLCCLGHQAVFYSGHEWPRV